MLPESLDVPSQFLQLKEKIRDTGLKIVLKMKSIHKLYEIFETSLTNTTFIGHLLPSRVRISREFLHVSNCEKLIVMHTFIPFYLD